MKILFIQTGGTIDKDYPRTTKGYAFEISEPAVKRIMEKINPSFDYEILSVLKKDSLDITETDRKKIFDACKSSKIDKIVITHGTDTMIETAKELNQIKGKTIVVTGAMRPERFNITLVALAGVSIPYRFNETHISNDTDTQSKYRFNSL